MKDKTEQLTSQEWAGIYPEGLQEFLTRREEQIRVKSHAEAIKTIRELPWWKRLFLVFQ